MSKDEGHEINIMKPNTGYLIPNDDGYQQNLKLIPVSSGVGCENNNPLLNA